MYGILSGLQRLQAGMGTNRVVLFAHSSTELARRSFRSTKGVRIVSVAVKRRHKGYGVRPWLFVDHDSSGDNLVCDHAW